MSDGPKLLIGIGVFLVLVGGFWWLVGRWLPFGRLPGDIAVERPGFRFYFPLATCILISVLLSILFQIINRFKK